MPKERNKADSYREKAYEGTICGNWSPFKDDSQATFFGERSGRTERFADAPSQQDISEAWQSYKLYLER